MTDSIERNVVALPDKRLHKKLVMLSQTVSDLGVEFTLNDTTALPHLSLYQAAYPADQEEPVIKALRQLAPRIPPFYIILGRFDIFWETLIFWDAVIDPLITRVHETLLRHLNPLRQGRLLSLHKAMLTNSDVSDHVKQSIRDNGSPLAGSIFRPHFTITRVKDKQRALEAIDRLNGKIRGDSCLVGKFCLTTVGPHGTCPQVLKQFPLYRR
jgi:2'-5' RNA ligase